MSPAEVLEALADGPVKASREAYLDLDVTRPLRSGSIGSVYLAKKRLSRDGHEVLMPVIIKVGRHNLDREFVMGRTTIGLTILSSQLWAPHSKLTPFLEAMQEQVDEFSRGFERELDFEAEARTQNKFARRSQRSQIWKVPKVYGASRRILEMEYLPDVVSLTSAADRFARRNRARFQRQLAERFLYTVLMHCLVYKEVHGDLHPGNVLVNARGDLFFIDWGNSVRLRGKWRLVWNYLLGMLAANIDLMTDTLIAISNKPEANAHRRQEIKSELSETLRRKRIEPLGKNFLTILRKEGIEGLHRRLQAALNLISNAQTLGLIVGSDYIHLSRSVVAFVGSYGALYEGLPKYTIVMDVTSSLSKFPLHLAKDRFDSRRKALIKRIWVRILSGNFLSKDLSVATP